MEKKEFKVSADLQKFIDEFEPNKFKMLARGIIKKEDSTFVKILSPLKYSLTD